MTTILVYSCDGSRPAGSTERCRGWLPLRTTGRLGDLHDAANAAGWTQDTEGNHYCPSCSRAPAAAR